MKEKEQYSFWVVFLFFYEKLKILIFGSALVTNNSNHNNNHNSHVFFRSSLIWRLFKKEDYFTHNRDMCVKVSMVKQNNTKIE